MTADDGVPTPSTFEITARVSRYAYDRLAFAGPIYAVALGTATVFSIGAVEGSLYLRSRPHKSTWLIRTRFVSRYAAYNIIPSLIWGTNAPSAIVASSSYLCEAMKPTNKWLYSLGGKAADVFGGTTMPPKRVLWVKILCALRGAVAGSVVLSNVIALTSLWQRAREDYAERIKLGREQPLSRRNHSTLWQTSGHSMDEHGCTIRLAGVRSDVTELSMNRKGAGRIWPVFEDTEGVQDLVSCYGGQDKDRQLLPQVPVYWQVNDGEYSKESSWSGMTVPDCWLYDIQSESGPKKKLLYLEADATSGGESALSLQKHSSLDTSEDNKWHWRHPYRRLLKDKRASDLLVLGTDEELSTAYFDLDLQEVAQGFRRLSELARRKNNGQLEVMRVLLVDPSVVIESGGGRKTTVLEYVKELGLADVIVDARGLVLRSILDWLDGMYARESGLRPDRDTTLKPVILETPSKAWFQSIRSELRHHGYNVIDRTEVTADDTDQIPMLVYQRSSADTVHTIRQYLERGIRNDPSHVCALLTCSLEEIAAFNKTLKIPVGYICSSDIHDRSLEWVRKQSVEGVPASKIQERLDSAKAD